MFGTPPTRITLSFFSFDHHTGSASVDDAIPCMPSEARSLSSIISARASQNPLLFLSSHEIASLSYDVTPNEIVYLNIGGIKCRHYSGVTCPEELHRRDGLAGGKRAERRGGATKNLGQAGVASPPSIRLLKAKRSMVP
jgi:hypothetical protein